MTQAKAFLDWTNGNLDEPWPNTLPAPNTPGALIESVNKAYLTGCGFILLHEIAHVVLRHANTPVRNPLKKIRREYDADDWATEAIVHGNYAKDLPLQLMSIGMIMGVIGAIEIGVDGERDHPIPPERLLHFYGHHVEPNCPDQAIRAGVIHALTAPVQAHIVAKGLAPLPMNGTVGDFLAAASEHYV